MKLILNFTSNSFASEVGFPCCCVNGNVHTDSVNLNAVCCAAISVPSFVSSSCFLLVVVGHIISYF